MEEKRMHAGETVAYIRMEDRGERTRLGRTKLTPVWYPVDHPLGKKDIVGYMKRVDGRVYSYYPNAIPDPDTNTKGRNLLNWAKDDIPVKEAKLGYYVAQAQVLTYTTIAYAITYILTDGQGFLLPQAMKALMHLL